MANPMIDFMPYDQQMAELQRRQRMAQMLQDQAAQPLESQVAPGGMVVPTSPVLGLAQLLKSYMGGKAQAAVGKETAAARQRARDEFGRFIEQTSPEAAPSPDMTLSQGDNPVMAPQTTPAQMRQRLIQGLASGNPMVEQYAQTMLAQKPEKPEYFDVKTEIGADGKPHSVQYNKQGGRVDLGVATPYQPPKEQAPPPTTNLARLLQEQAGLPEGDPRRSIYQNAIDKETKLPAAPPQFSPDAVASLAARVIGGDKTALTGLGRSTAAMATIQNEVANQLRNSGASPTAVADASRKLTVRAKTETEFTNGQPAKTLQSLNTFTQHANHLEELAKAIDRGDVTAINALQSVFQSQFGVSAPNNLALVGQLVADELQKAALGGPGGQEERTALVARLTGAKSGKVIVDALNQARGLVKGQLGSLQKRWESGYGDPQEFNQRFLTEDSARMFAPPPPPPPAASVVPPSPALSNALAIYGLKVAK